MAKKKYFYTRDIINMRDYINSAILKDNDILKLGNIIFSNIKKNFNETGLIIVKMFRENSKSETELLFMSGPSGTMIVKEKKNPVFDDRFSNKIISTLKSDGIYFIKNILNTDSIKYLKQDRDNGFVSLILKPLYMNNAFRGVLEILTKKQLSLTKTGLHFFNEIALSLSDALGYYLLLYELAKVNEILKSSFSNVIELLISLIELKDKYTLGHSINVRNISVLIARQMRLEENVVNEIGYAAALHDIGKIAIPENILNKPSKLTIKEFNEVKRHPVQGAFLVANIPSLKDVGKIILHHHERYDGKGYPMGLGGPGIPIGSRIIAVADTYDAMTSERSYRGRMLEVSAINTIKEEAGFQFDPEVVEAFLAIVFKISKKKEYTLNDILESKRGCRNI